MPESDPYDANDSTEKYTAREPASPAAYADPLSSSAEITRRIPSTWADARGISDASFFCSLATLRPSFTPSSMKRCAK